jgi:hypothetical protein
MRDRLGERRAAILEDADQERRQANNEVPLIGLRDVRRAATALNVATDQLDSILVSDLFDDGWLGHSQIGINANCTRTCFRR